VAVHFGEFFGVEADRGDADLLELAVEAGGGQGAQRRWQLAAHVGRGRECAADGLAAEHRGFVEQLHRVAEQDLAVQVGAAVGRHEVVQVEGQRGVGEALPAGVVAGGQALVAPGGVGGDLVQEEVELGGFAAVGGHHPVGRADADGDRAAQHADGVVLDQPVVEQVAQHGADPGDGEGGAHGCLPSRRARYSSRDIGWGRLGGLRLGARPAGGRR
jgi:hypothetical protein